MRTHCKLPASRPPITTALGLIHGYFGLGDASETARREAQPARADFKARLEKGA